MSIPRTVIGIIEGIALGVIDAIAIHVDRVERALAEEDGR